MGQIFLNGCLIIESDLFEVPPSIYAIVLLMLSSGLADSYHLLFSAIFLILKESHPLKANIFLRLLANCSGRMTRFEFENFLSPNCSKFAIECD